MQETWVYPQVRKIPWRREWQPTPVFLGGEFHGQKSLVGYSSWGCEESDMTEWLTLLTLYISLQKVWVWGVIIKYYLPVSADRAFDLIHEAQMIGSWISLSVSRGHTLCLDRKSIFENTMSSGTCCHREWNCVFATRSIYCFGYVQVTNINSILWNLRVFQLGKPV